jgi:hypothetical protein
MKTILKIWKIWKTTSLEDDLNGWKLAKHAILNLRPGSFNLLFIVLPPLAAGQNLMKIKNKND